MIRQQGYQDFFLIGHSLGAQCSGLVGRHLQKISNNTFIIPRIYALDPAGPGFESPVIHEYFESIKKTDAAYVQIIHTNGNMYGLTRAAGHSDFFLNGGMNQPGCLTNTCSHLFAWIAFAQSVSEEGAFVARKCDSYRNFLDGYCESDEITYMGYSSNGTLPMGKFYLRTDTSKYGSALGYDGIKINEFHMIYEDGRRVKRENLAFQAPSAKLVDPKNGLFGKDLPYHEYSAHLKASHHHARNKKTRE